MAPRLAPYLQYYSHTVPNSKFSLALKGRDPLREFYVIRWNSFSHSLASTYYSFQFNSFFGGGFLPPVEGFRFLPLYYSYCKLTWEARGNHCHTLLEHQANPRSCRRRPPSPLSSWSADVICQCSRLPARNHPPLVPWWVSVWRREKPRTLAM